MESYSKAALPIVLLACLYIITGKLGLELAVPPGYATMLWPPSGIALGMLILYGWRLWPGVLIGSFLLNSIVAEVFSFNEQMLAVDLAKAGSPFFIAVGSTLQAVAGALLIRQVLGVPLDLKKVGDVFKLFFLGGPLTCLIAATIGTATLYAYGLAPLETIPHNWFSWWIGDVFGIVVFLPLVLLFPSDNGARIRWQGTLFGSLPFLSVVAVIIPLGLTFYLWKITSEKTYLQANIEFQALTQDNENALRYRMSSYAHALLGGLAYFQNMPDLSREGWNNYISVMPLRENYTGINGIGVIYPVENDKMESFVAEARKGGVPDFTVHPATQDLPHYVIKYICPEEDNKQAIGLDIGFEEHRRQAAELARDTGNPAITKKIYLVQDKTKSPGFLLLYPAYREAERIRTLEQKRAALRGWIYAPFIAENFLKDLTRAQERDFTLRIYDSGTETPDNLIYQSGNKEDNHNPGYTIRKKISIMQQEWLIVWDSTKAFEKKAASDEPLIILIWGLFFTLLFALFLVIFSIRQTQTLEYLVKERAYIFPLLAFGLSFCGTLYLGKITQDREDHYIHSLLDENAERISSMISVDTREIILALQRLGGRWNAANGTPPAIWEEDTRNYVNDFSSLKTIVWVDKNNYVQRITPLTGFQKQIGLNIADTPEKAAMLKDSAQNSRVVVSEPLTLTKGYKGILIYIPVKAYGQPDGFVIGALSTQQLFDTLNTKEKLDNFNLTVFYDGAPFYSALESGEAADSSFNVIKSFTIGEKHFSFTLTPTKDYIKSISGYLPITIVIVGFFISLLLSITIRAILVSRIRAAYLKDARIAAEAANHAKSLFLSNISHEIRTPLNGVLATAELLEKTPLNETQEKYLGIIRNAGALLFNLLNDVLDLSKIEIHKLELHDAVYDLHKTIQFTVDLFRSAARQKGLRLDMEIAPDLPVHVWGDAHRVSQILTNLIGNAIKYTETGSIEVLAGPADKDGTLSLKVEVRDTGIGIPTASLDVVFDRFTQAHADKVKIAGTGLGLAICKSLVGMMGGEINVRSTEGQGSTFWFVIPLMAREAPDNKETETKTPEAPLPKDARILLAEDVEANRIIIADMLAYLGCKTDLAANGQEALDMCADNTYDVVFMDCNMPVMDGYDATRKIRELYGPAMPVIAISAHAFTQDIQKCYEAGMNDYVQKPVKIDDIRKCLLKWLKAEGAASRPAEEITTPDINKSARDKPAPGDFQADIAILREITGNNPEKQEKLISLILKSADNLSEEIKRGLKDKDRTLLHDSAHALKSTAAQAGGISLSTLCAYLEKNTGSETEEGSAPVFTDEITAGFNDEYRYFKRFLEKHLASIAKDKTPPEENPPS